MKLSVIVPSLTGEMPDGLQACTAGRSDVELVVVKGMSPVAAARNEGLARATGDYVAWVDADDAVTEDWLKVIEQALAENPNVDILSFNVRVEWHDGSGRPDYQLDGRTAGQLWSKIFRRALFRGLAFEGAVHEDWRIQCQLPKKINRVHLARVLYIYRRNRDGLSQHRNAWAEWKALWGLLCICRDWKMFRGICERFWDFAKTPFRRLRGR